MNQIKIFPINTIGGESKKICSFDLAEETSRYEPWVGNEEETKKMLDFCINGGTYQYDDARGHHEIIFAGLLNQYEDKKFKESLGEYSFNTGTTDDSTYDDSLDIDIEADSSDSVSIKNNKKRVIIYTLQN